MTDRLLWGILDTSPKSENRILSDEDNRCDLRTLRKNIADGNYRVSSGQVAEKILSTQRFLFDDTC